MSGLSRQPCHEKGVISEAYKDIFSGMKVNSVMAYWPNVTDAEILKMSNEQMRPKAAPDYLVKDAERNLVYCPWATSSEEIYQA